MSSRHTACPQRTSSFPSTCAELPRLAVISEAFYDYTVAARCRHCEGAVEGRPARWDDKKVYRRGCTALDIEPFWCLEAQAGLKLMHTRGPDYGLFCNAMEVCTAYCRSIVLAP
jgi:hypothetical protein